MQPGQIAGFERREAYRADSAGRVRRQHSLNMGVLLEADPASLALWPCAPPRHA